MARTDTAADGDRRLQAWAAVTIGGVVALVGVVGFVLVPREGQLFGIFGVNTLHNAVHLLTGAVGLVAGYAAAGTFAGGYNRYGGIAYLLLAGLWLVIPALLSDLLNIGLADTLLHLGLGVALALVGFGVVDRM